ncbi:outer membrane protein/peptidoglycan-associated (lipo)protein [Beggiatoa alba B18LD]|uniref:Outer membrane protein/peptidoglycan-associated (Lipo)protein n=1 Tax=Beggiatoa alba B18LD TaxID=395493 RepID=I3CHC5_9GAMM|nr:OmpA family protein [Beggiatoa alba]EIJ43018.1 outer membrane protein/peptidoglycan-associated (lipo)protein [Beggiatoa alba B18LD]
MVDISARKVLVGMVAGALLSSAFSTQAAEDERTYRLMSGQGTPVMSGTGDCVITPQSPNIPNLNAKECGDKLQSTQCPHLYIYPGTATLVVENLTPEQKSKGVDEKGCPLDTDRDTVPDFMDLCPTNTSAEISAGVWGDAKNPPQEQGDKIGCPIDSDHDGVPDYRDKCPGTPRGTSVDADGCPAVSGKTVEILGGDVTFAFNKADLTAQGKATLDKIAANIIKDIDYVYDVHVTGHTDSVGSEKYNQTLSERRAKSAADYLISKGVPANKVIMKGEGELKPIADNKTAEGRAKNRRVEIEIRTTHAK